MNDGRDTIAIAVAAETEAAATSADIDLIPMATSPVLTQRPFDPRLIFALAMALLPLAGRAQINTEPPGTEPPAPPGINLFGDDLVRNVDSKARLPPEQAAQIPDSLQQILVFNGGEQLRGKLISLDGAEVRWSRPDIAGVCRFARR